MRINTGGMRSLLISIILLSITPILIKWIQLSAASIVVFRCLVGAMALLGYMLLARKPVLLPNARAYFHLAIPGLLLGMHWFAYFQAIQSSTVAIAVLTLYTFPVFTAIFEPLFGGRKPGLVDLIIILWIMGGLYLVLPSISIWNTQIYGALWGLVSAIIFAARNLISQQLLQSHSGANVMLHQLWWAGICFIPFANDLDGFLIPVNLGTGLALAIILTAIAHSLWVQSHASISALRIGMLSCLAPVLSLIWAIIFFDEWPSFRSFWGGIMILGAALFEVYKQSQIKTTSPQNTD